MNGIPAACGAHNAHLIDPGRKDQGDRAGIDRSSAAKPESSCKTTSFANSKPEFDNEWAPVMLFRTLALDLPVFPARPAGRFVEARIHGRFRV